MEKISLDHKTILVTGGALLQIKINNVFLGGIIWYFG
jgi:hypothetical protein